MIFINGEQLNWLFTEHGTTEEKTRKTPTFISIQGDKIRPVPILAFLGNSEKKI